MNAATGKGRIGQVGNDHILTKCVDGDAGDITTVGADLEADKASATATGIFHFFITFLNSRNSRRSRRRGGFGGGGFRTGGGFGGGGKFRTGGGF